MGVLYWFGETIMLDEVRWFTRGYTRSQRPWCFSLFLSVRVVLVLVRAWFGLVVGFVLVV